MSWSRPVYTRVEGFTSSQSRMGNKYAIYLYREGGIDPAEVVVSRSNVPVLFIPGNAGSYKQGRSIASYCAKKTAELVGSGEGPAPKLDFFLADFQEDFTAFHGRTLLDQAQYLNDAIEYILSLYQGENGEGDGAPAPTSVVVIGHSMGGIVARTLVTLPNYIPESINTIITLSTPHTLPPLTFDKDITVIYDKVNQYWRRAFAKEKRYLQVGTSEQENEQENDRENDRENDLDHGPLAETSLISVTGGQSDTMVPSDYTAISSIVPASHGFTVFSSAVPFVWTGVDHLAMVWCAQLRQAVGDALFDIVDTTKPHRTIPLSSRMSVFKKHLLSGFEEEARQEDTDVPIHKIVLDHWNGVAQLLEVPDINGKLAIGPLSPNSAVWAPDYLKTSVKGKSPVLLCRLPQQVNSTSLAHLPSDYIDWTTGSGPEGQQSVLECVDLHQYSPKFPLVTDLSAIYPFEYDHGRHLSVHVQQDEHEKFPLIVHAVNKNTESHLTISPANSIVKITDSLLRLAFVGRTIRISNPFTHVSLDSVSSSLLSYKVRLNSAPFTSQCSTRQTYFLPYIRQYIDEPHESRIHVNALNRPITVVSHGASPFVPNTLPKTNVHLQVFVPQFSCADSESIMYSLSVSIDLLASLGNLAIRYRTLIASLPLAITCLIFLLQLEAYNGKGIFISFGDGLNAFTKGPLLILLLVCQVLYFALSQPFMRSIFLSLQIPSEYDNISALQDFNPDINQNDIFVGTSEVSLWGIVPLLILVSTGLCYMVHYLLKLLIDLSIFLPTFGSSSEPEPDLATNEITKDPKPRTLSTTKPQRRRRTIITSIVSLFVLFFIPYQIAFLAVFLRQLVNAGSSLRKIKLGSKQNNNNNNGDNSTINSILSTIRLNNNLYNFNMTIAIMFLWVSIINTPLLVIWIHNLSLQWSIAFSSRNNILAVLPSILLVQENASGSMLPRMSGRLQRGFTLVILSYISIYATLYGFLHTYMLHHLVNYLAAWLLVIYFDDPGVRTRVGRFLS
ncbi:Bst1p [Sugiyamaella lignohabitans]|uniref:GPI inositol-deacylase n=1 Tax=Sugiyamaella lignohabitans TaxID=796027 RepID=A0A161HH81_9ASCO|nr:Bst1p [Sugiyamaella lignohabitans]ANB11427.1 Bst1p [Sugiyamaella lignohabitans]